jgi:hypothetical protein
MSIARISIIAVVIGAVILIGGFAIYTIEQQSYRSPLVIDPPDGSSRLQQQDLGANTRRTFYVNDQPTEEVAAYYDRIMAEYYDTDPQDLMRERCRRIPDGTAISPEYAPGNGVVPYEYRCMFDRSTFNLDQFTEVIIQPGIRDDSRSLDFEGRTIIQYEQYWQP